MTTQQDWIDQEEQVVPCRKFADMSDTALLSTYEFYRIACGIHEGRLPRLSTMQSLWQVWCELRLREEMSESEGRASHEARHGMDC
jgi:hypothetical protein